MNPDLQPPDPGWVKQQLSHTCAAKLIQASVADPSVPRRPDDGTACTGRDRMKDRKRTGGQQGTSVFRSRRSPGGSSSVIRIMIPQSHTGAAKAKELEEQN